MNNVDVKRLVRYFWDPEPKNDEPSGAPIWCLGREYFSTSSFAPKNDPSGTGTSPDSTETKSTAGSESDITGTSSSRATSLVDGEPDEVEYAEGGWPVAFLDDFESKIWMSYRSDFPPISKSQGPSAGSSITLSVRLRSLAEPQGFTKDTGWGCMIRSGQSLLANTLIILRLGRDWRRKNSNDGDGMREQESRIVSLFADDSRAPFSIHRFVEHGASACGKQPGEWFGPSATARCIQDLSTECKDAGLNVYVTSDSPNVYEDRFRQIACADTGAIKPTLILLGIRLGIDRVTPVYWEALKAALQYPQSIGIAGGRPSSSHYFVGTQGSNFFYLDPHQTRPALPYHGGSELCTREELDSCHSRRLRSLHIKEMDPSMLMGFLIRDEDDWYSWKRNVLEVQGKPIIHVSDKEPSAAGEGVERQGAVDEVEVLDDEDDDDKTEVGAGDS